MLNLLKGAGFMPSFGRASPAGSCIRTIVRMKTAAMGSQLPCEAAAGDLLVLDDERQIANQTVVVRTVGVLEAGE